MKSHVYIISDAVQKITYLLEVTPTARIVISIVWLGLFHKSFSSDELLVEKVTPTDKRGLAKKRTEIQKIKVKGGYLVFSASIPIFYGTASRRNSNRQVQDFMRSQSLRA
jgi:hypothetical protein